MIVRVQMLMLANCQINSFVVAPSIVPRALRWQFGDLVETIELNSYKERVSISKAINLMGKINKTIISCASRVLCRPLWTVARRWADPSCDYRVRNEWQNVNESLNWNDNQAMGHISRIRYTSPTVHAMPSDSVSHICNAALQNVIWISKARTKETMHGGTRDMGIFAPSHHNESKTPKVKLYLNIFVNFNRLQTSHECRTKRQEESGFD